MLNLRKWLERLERNSYQQIVSYLELRAILGYDHRIPPLRGWSISPDLALLLIRLLETKKPRSVLDLGSGFSTVICARYAKQSDATVISVDHNSHFAKQTRSLLKEWKLQDYARVITAKMACGYYDLTPLLQEKLAFDFVVIDGPPAGAHRDPMVRGGLLPRYSDLLVPRAIIIMDDYKREGEQMVVSKWASAGLVKIMSVDTTLDKHAAILRFEG